jgi:cytochrome c553
LTFYRSAALGIAALFCLADCAWGASDPPPPWAFPVKPDHAPAEPKQDPKKVERLAGSKSAYTVAQLSDAWFAPDWFPAEHPVMPAIVAYGRKPGPWPCAGCHTETGVGGPESAALTGLPAQYIVEQVMEFKAGRRHAAEAKMESPHDMEKEAQRVSAADLQAAADYFSHLVFHARMHVVESDTAPKAVVHDGLLYAAAPGAQPLGQRIVELPDDIHQWDLGNPNMTFTAYVPRGSIRRGESLVASGNGAAPCRSCHGLDLKGMGLVPPLAGRSPSYLVRQLYDIQYGTRSGPAVALMQPEVANMASADRIAIAAYLGSLRP